MALSEQEELELLTLEREKSAPAPVKSEAPARPLTKDKYGAVDEFLIGKLSKAPGLGNAPDIQGSTIGRLIQGAADMPVGALQLAANAVGLGNPINQRIKEINDRTEALRGPNAGFDWSRLVGNVASPLGLAAAAKIPVAASRMGKVGQGAALGAVGGLTAPVTDGGEDFTSTKAIQTATGTGLGAVIPGVAPLVTIPAKAVYNAAIEPWMNPAAIKGRAFLEAAGDKADDIITILRGNKQMVPGSMPTAGEAAAPAGRAEFSALQKQAEAINPSAYAGRADEQNAARVAAIRTVGQDEAALDAATRARSAASTPLYQAARENVVPVDARPVLFKLDKLLVNNPGNPELVSALNSVRKGLVGPEGRPSYDAQELSSVIDGLKAARAKKENSFIGGQLKSIQDDLEKTIPGYEAAQNTFRKMSEPVNQMQVGQYLEGKLVPALSDEAKQKAATYSSALRDAPGTIKRATGAPRYDDLTKVLTPQQMDIVNGIRDDLARGAKFEDLARKGAKAAPDITNTAGNSKLTGMLDRAVTIYNAIIERLQGKVNKKLAAEIAVEMLDPVKVGESLAKAQARAQRNKALVGFVEKSAQTATPGVVNAVERQ